jgi:hypothetical protein
VTNLFGIEGLTVNGLGIWGILLLLAGGIAVWWVRGMPDRKRADNEAIPVESAATDVLFKNMQAEIRRMGQKVDRLERRVGALEDENRTLVRERDAALAKVARLEAIADGRGEMRQRAATIVAVERIQDRNTGAEK